MDSLLRHRLSFVVALATSMADVYTCRDFELVDRDFVAHNGVFCSAVAVI